MKDEPDCEHEWGGEHTRPGNEFRNGEGGGSCFEGRDDKAEINAGMTPPRRTRTANDCPNSPKQTSNTGTLYDATGGQLCLKCGCWRGTLGNEPTPALFVWHLVLVFREVRRVLRDDGVLFLDLGDSYSGTGYGKGTGHFGQRDNPGAMRQKAELAPGLKAKDLTGIPWMTALALRADGWWLRADCIWAKGISGEACKHGWSGSPMPESCGDRPTRAHEYIFVLAKSPKYFWDAEAGKENNADPQRKNYQGGPCIHSDGYATATGDRHHGFGNTGRAMTDYAGAGRNLRSVWTLSRSGGSWAYCRACKRFYSGREYGRLPQTPRLDAEGKPRSKPNGKPVTVGVCACGSATGWHSHYASFPVALPDLCIRLGSSEKGCCPKCGKPWVRTKGKATGGTIGHAWLEHEHDAERGNFKTESSKGYRSAPSLGWRPACSCGAGDPVPCLVLDPFSGSGASGLAALRLGRTYVGIDCNEDYCDLSEKRLARALDPDDDGPAPAPDAPGQLSMFGAAE